MNFGHPRIFYSIVSEKPESKSPVFYQVGLSKLRHLLLQFRYDLTSTELLELAKKALTYRNFNDPYSFCSKIEANEIKTGISEQPHIVLWL